MKRRGIAAAVVTPAMWNRLLPVCDFGFCRLCGEQLLLGKDEKTLTHGGEVCEWFVATALKAGSFACAVEVLFIPAPSVNAVGGVA